MKKAMVLFLIGALGYCALEVLSRGYTHWSMGVTGGVCLIAIEKIYMHMSRFALAVRAAAASLAVTAAELFVGLLVNVWLRLDVWSYEHEAFNFMGQICLKYTVIWFILCFILMTAFSLAKTIKAQRQLESEQ